MCNNLVKFVGSSKKEPRAWCEKLPVFMLITYVCTSLAVPIESNLLIRFYRWLVQRLGLVSQVVLTCYRVHVSVCIHFTLMKNRPDAMLLYQCWICQNYGFISEPNLQDECLWSVCDVPQRLLIILPLNLHKAVIEFQSYNTYYRTDGNSVTR